MKVSMNTGNSTNFQGTVKYNGILDSAICAAKTKHLKKFEKLVRKIQAVDDKWEYSLSFDVSFNDDTFAHTRKLQLVSNSLGVLSYRTIGEETVRTFERYQGKYFKNALKKITSLIKGDYKKARPHKDRKSTEQSIYNLLTLKKS